MNRNTLIFASMLVLCLALPACCSVPETGKASQGNVNGTVRDDPSASVTVRPDLHPMPVAFVATLLDPGYSATRDILLKTHNLDEPRSEVVCVFSYHGPQSDIFQGYGNITGNGEDFYHRFASSRPFADLLNYMAAHPNVFFDHSEFLGAPPNEYQLPEGAEEFFELRAHDGCGDNCDYAVAKGLVPGEPGTTELQHVFEQLRAWRNELLQHPGTGLEGALEQGGQGLQGQ